MIKKGFLLSTAVLLVLAGCGQKGTTLHGNLTNAEGEMALLEKLSAQSAVPVDSIEVGSKGDFKLSAGEIQEPGFYRLSVNKNNFVILLLDKDEKVEVNGNALDFYRSYEIEGSEGSKKLMTLDQRLRADYEKTDSLKKVFQGHQQAGNPRLDSIAESIDAYFQKMQEAKRQYVLDFIKNNPNSLASLSAVQSLNPSQDLEVFQQVADNLTASMPNSEYVKSFKTQLIDIKSRAQASNRTSVGSQAPEIALLTPDGKPIKLSDFKGKVTMIDFWASWCKPCRMENPNVVKVYNKYKSKGFEIFGVSLDQNGEKWIEAIKQDGLTWKHGSELKFWQSSFVPAYNLDGIPMTYLLDENGIIIAKGLRGQQLEEKLKEIFG